MQTQIDIVPIGERIIVLRDKAVTKTEGGIELPKEAQDLPVEGTVIVLGTGYDSAPCVVKQGDRVLFTPYTGQRLDAGRKEDEYLVMRPDELLGVRRTPKAQGKSKAAA